MMLRVLIVTFMLCGTALPAAAQSDGLRDAMIEELVEDGYTSIRVSRTLLGRMRFVATRPGARREIVVNPTTGVILRDYFRILETEQSEEEDIGSGSSGGQGDDDDDDHPDDEDADDGGEEDEEDEEDEPDDDDEEDGS